MDLCSRGHSDGEWILGACGVAWHSLFVPSYLLLLDYPFGLLESQRQRWIFTVSHVEVGSKFLLYLGGNFETLGHVLED
jgi:fumarate reductase subunit D